MILYHGSTEAVQKPSIKKCRPHNDYGPGFYCTLDRGLACEWACKRPGGQGFCNEYELDESKLVVLDLDEHADGVLAWLAVLMEHRIFDMEWNVAHAKEKFVERYRVDLSGADVVCGYRADDSYFSIARAFVSGAITDDQAAAALRLGDLGRQVVLRSPKAFRAVQFVRAEHVAGAQWYSKWADRDRKARASFRSMLAEDSVPAGRRIFELIGE